MSDRVLYLGDTSLHGAAAYLAGLMTRWGWAFDYVPSDRSVDSAVTDDAYGLYILSDYPAAQLRDDRQHAILRHVEQGAGLIMIGGWESFTGCDGHWRGTPIGDALPVQMSEADDRVNCHRPAFAIRSGVDHAITADLPWDEHPPLIGGYNRFVARPGAAVLLDVQHFTARRTGDAFAFDKSGADPLLVVGSHCRGRTAALATDVAPHWIGPMVDWGDTRVIAEAAGAIAIEVGSHYARFFEQLLGWARSSD